MLTASALVTPTLGPALLPDVAEAVCSLVRALWPLPAWDFKVQQNVPSWHGVLLNSVSSINE